MISFQPTDDQTLMRDAIGQFARETLLPRAREFEAARGVSSDVRRTAHELGLGLVAFPEEVGGQGQGLVTLALLEEELGSADAAAAFGLAGPHAFGLAIQELGTPDQARRELASFGEETGCERFGAVAWSEPAVLRERAGFATIARAENGGYRLDGKKAFVGNASLADRFVVFATVEPERGWNGIGAFVVRRDNPGLSVGERHVTLGLDAADFGQITLKDARVESGDRLFGDEGENGFTNAVLRFFAKRAIVVAARSVGVARFAFDLAREYCDTRKAFGKPIGHFQAVAFTLADRLMDVESSRWLVWRAADAWDKGLPAKEALTWTAKAVAHTLEATMRTTDDCVGLHGGSGFIRDLIAEKLMRDSKQLALCCPTAEHFDQLAAALELGLPMDPALVLPTPDTQAIFT